MSSATSGRLRRGWTGAGLVAVCAVAACDNGNGATTGPLPSRPAPPPAHHQASLMSTYRSEYIGRYAVTYKDPHDDGSGWST